MESKQAPTKITSTTTTTTTTTGDRTKQTKTKKGRPAHGDLYCNVGAGRGSSSCISGPWAQRPESTRTRFGSDGPDPIRNSGTPGLRVALWVSHGGSSPAGLEPHAGESCPGPLCRPSMGLGCAAACTTHQPAVQPGLVTLETDCGLVARWAGTSASSRSGRHWAEASRPSRKRSTPVLRGTMPRQRSRRSGRAVGAAA
jgi:hypothetical protein